MVLVVITVPIVVHGLGESAYGIYVIATLLMGYVAFLDLGLTPAAVRSLAMYYGTGTDEDLNRIIGTALTLLTGLGIIGGGVLALAAPLAVTSILHVPTALQPDAVFVLRLSALGFCINMPLTLFGAVPQALQRLDLFAIRSVLLTTASAAAQILAVKLGGGLRWVAGATILINVVSLLVFVLVARQLLPTVRYRPQLDRWAVRQLGSFGLMRFLNQISGQVVFQLDRLILAAFLPIRAVTLYSVPLSVAQRLTVIQSIFSYAFFPAASELHGVQEGDRLRRLYVSSLKLSLVMVLPIVVLLSGFARPFLDAWVGHSFAQASTTIMVVLAIAYGVATLIGVPALASDATGHAHWTAAFAILSAIINLSLTLILVPRFGSIGAALALLINGGTQGIFFIYVVQRWFVRVRLREIFRDAVLRPALAGLVLFPYAILLAPHLHSLLGVIIALLAGGLLYLGSTVVVGVWDATETRLALAMVGAAITGLRRAM